MPIKNENECESIVTYYSISMQYPQSVSLKKSLVIRVNKCLPGQFRTFRDENWSRILNLYTVKYKDTHWFWIMFPITTKEMVKIADFQEHNKNFIDKAMSV